MTALSAGSLAGVAVMFLYSISPGSVGHHRPFHDAVHMLREAIQRGYRDLKHLKENAVFECLRSREDFKRLIKGAEASPTARASR